MSAEVDPELLELYLRELAYLRERGADFAVKYPKVATRLGIAGRQCSDPHVERLLEAFAFLTARLQLKLEQDSSHLTTALLGVLYPQYTSPLPSMAIAAFDVDLKEVALTSGHTIEKGALLYAEAPSGPTCRLRTCYPVTLWPVKIETAAFMPWDDLGLKDSQVPTSEDGTIQRPLGAIRIRLSSGPPLNALGLKRLRFFVCGDEVESSKIFDLLFERERLVLLSRAGNSVATTPGRILPVGFESNEDVLEFPRHAHPGHRLIQEYFTFPRKFHFFDVELEGLPDARTADLLIFLDRRPNGTSIRNDTFRLGCTPVVNLFPRTTEPIRIDHRRSEYRLVADARRERFTEVHSIQQVTATGSGEPDQRPYAPFFSFSHPDPNRFDARVFWAARRVATDRTDLPGTDVYLSFVDLDFQPNRPVAEVVYARVLCTNRDLAEEMETGTALALELPAPVGRAECITKPTSQVAAPLGGQALWRLISNLSLNHLSLTGERGTDALREILRAYSFRFTAGVEKQIAAIADVDARTVSARVGSHGWRGFCRGTQIMLKLDETQFTDSSPVLFGEVLSRFLSLYAHINSFTELVLRSTTREEEWKRWPPMAGAKPLL